MPHFKAPARAKPFHLRYLELCKSKNLLPLPEVRVKNKEFSILDFFADRVKLEDWMSIFNALYYDTSLHYVAIKLRKNNPNVLENINSIKKARKIHGSPVILTNVLFTQLVDTVCTFMTNNDHLTTLMLEGLPLKENFITYIAKGLSSNCSIKNLSFARSALGDEGCEIICSTIKYLPNIDCLNMSYCILSAKGSESIANMINFQKIVRFTKGWESTLRYRSINPDILPGLKRITINGNPLKDEGLYFLTEVLKEDVWIKALDLQNCGLTDEGAKMISDCLDYNNTLMMIDIQGNSGISGHFLDHIKLQLGSDSEESSSDGHNHLAKCDTKVTVGQLKEKIKNLELQLETEKFQRRELESFNERLRSQLIETEKQMSAKNELAIPDGFTLIETEYFNELVSKRNRMLNNWEQVPTKQQRSYANQKPLMPRVNKAKSEIVHTKHFHSTDQKGTKSQYRFPCVERPVLSPVKAPYVRSVGNGLQETVCRKRSVGNDKIFVEKNIGDTCDNIPAERCEEDILKIFMKKKTNPCTNLMNLECLDANSDELNFTM